MTRLLSVALLILMLVTPAFAQSPLKLVVYITGAEIREITPGSDTWQVVTQWVACPASAHGCLPGETVEPLNVETSLTTNMRIENDAKAKMQVETGLTIGTTHVFGGRTS